MSLWLKKSFLKEKIHRHQMNYDVYYNSQIIVIIST